MKGKYADFIARLCEVSCATVERIAKFKKGHDKGEVRRKVKKSREGIIKSGFEKMLRKRVKDKGVLGEKVTVDMMKEWLIKWEYAPSTVKDETVRKAIRKAGFRRKRSRKDNLTLVKESDKIQMQKVVFLREMMQWFEKRENGEDIIFCTIDESYVRGYVRAGKALLALGDATQNVGKLKRAREMLYKALDLDASNSSAKAALKDVESSLQLFDSDSD